MNSLAIRAADGGHEGIRGGGARRDGAPPCTPPLSLLGPVDSSLRALSGYIQIYTYICFYAYICIHLYTYIHIHVYIHMYIYRCLAKSPTLFAVSWNDPAPQKTAPFFRGCTPPTTLFEFRVVDRLISHNAFLKSFCKSQFSHTSVNSFFIFVTVKDKLTNLWGS
jgi:hypothetical protein